MTNGLFSGQFYFLEIILTDCQTCNRNILNTGQICFVFLININSLCIIPVLRIFIKTFYAFLTKTHAGECEQYTLVRSLMYQDIFGTRTSLKDPIVFIARVN